MIWLNWNVLADFETIWKKRTVKKRCVVNAVRYKRTVSRMDNYTATEQAYKNGYEQGKKDAVKHGRWIFHKDGSGTCDQCRFTQKHVYDDDNHQNYCGVCGAKMDGGSAE